MSEKIIGTVIQIRRDTEANWLANKDVVLKAGEPAMVLDGKNKGGLKLGDGVTTWENLPFLPSSEEIANLPQPDWNQNDDTQPDYVKNRPFYTGDPVETVLVEESTVTFEDVGGFYEASSPPTFEATVGDVYKVSWDGTVYECTCVDLDGVSAIGNLSIIGASSDTGEPFVIGIQNGEGTQILTADTSASHIFSISGIVAPVVKIDAKYLPMPISFKPAGKSYMTFSSPFRFTLKVYDATKHWDGTLEYFASDKTWTVWDGTTALSSIDSDGEYVLYLRGTGNTVITGSGENYRWVLTGTDIKCIGNIENLLDYTAVASGAHPTMASSCYSYMFSGCISLTQAPSLPATTLANYCYYHMFNNCARLTQAPALPATTLAINCYAYMFYNCKSLVQAPALPATTLVNYCYYSMFHGCTRLTQAPVLPATTLAGSCYSNMFYGCTSLVQAPALPATTLAEYCYYQMFNGCTALTQAPALPAITLASDCYAGMFRGCTSLKLSSTQTGEYTQEYRIPSSGDGVTVLYAMLGMFTSTGGTFTGTPSINTTYYLSSDNMIVRETEIATLNGYVGAMIDASGERLPEGATAYQQLVTDGEGNTKWEDRLCYKGEGYAAVLDSSQFTSAYTGGQGHGYSYNGQEYILAIIYEQYIEQIPLLSMFLPNAEPFPVGAKCKVTFDDTVYDCEIVEDAEYRWHIGNMSISQPSNYPDTGEPFCFEFGEPGYNLYIPGEYKSGGNYVYTLHGLKIEMVSETVVPIDPKWLPVVDSVILNSSTNGSSKKFKITVDDSGVISATEVT